MSSTYRCDLCEMDFELDDCEFEDNGNPICPSCKQRVEWNVCYESIIGWCIYHGDKYISRVNNYICERMFSQIRYI